MTAIAMKEMHDRTSSLFILEPLGSRNGLGSRRGEPFMTELAVRWIAMGNLAGGLLALAAATTTPMPGGSLFHGPTYILGLFEVNALHGLMHLLVGGLGFAFWTGAARGRWYLWAHTLWFSALAMVGFVWFSGLQPEQTLLGLAINQPDHFGHVFLVGLSLLALLLTSRHEH